MTAIDRVFITGGAAGLGRALAAGFARRGAKICIGDIDDAAGNAAAEELRASGVDAHFIHCDVRKVEDPQAAADWLLNNWGGVDLVVNNAGVAQMGPIEKTTVDDWSWIIDINVLGIVRSTQAFLPLFCKQGEGRFLNIASMAGFIHLPGASAYNATKAAVVAVSETLMLELEQNKIAVQVACPAFFRTSLAKNMRASDPDAERITKRLVERSRLGAEDIAAAILAGLDRGDSHIFTHPQSKRAWLLKRLLPFSKYLNLIRKQQKQMDARMSRPERTKI